MAIDSCDAEFGPRAAIALAELLEQAGDLAGARAAYQAAIDSGHAEHRPRAAIGLGALLAGQGEVADARAAYQVAIDSGHLDLAPQAADALGVTLAAGHGDDGIEAAISAFGLAAQSGQPRYARESGWTLGMLHGLHGDFPAARAAFRTSAQARPPAAAAAAMISYAGILASEFGDFEGAVEFLREIIDSQDRAHAVEARVELDMITAAGGDLDAYRRSIDAAWAQANRPDRG